jgi:hypothetical protein
VIVLAAEVGRFEGESHGRPLARRVVVAAVVVVVVVAVLVVESVS